MDKLSMIPSPGKAISVMLPHSDITVVDFVRGLSAKLSECLFCGSAMATLWPLQPHQPISPKGNPSPPDGKLEGCSFQ